MQYSPFIMAYIQCSLHVMNVMVQPGQIVLSFSIFNSTLVGECGEVTSKFGLVIIHPHSKPYYENIKVFFFK